uniref:Uncharacterized protein n=1 Tax=Romanomermis culicivorax TaxID=13658 RepID=A0A915HX30_ROMCU
MVNPKWTYEQLKASEGILILQNGVNRFASQKGMTSFGTARQHIYKSQDLGYIVPDPCGEEILRLQCGTNGCASQKGSSFMSSFRPNVQKIVYKGNVQDNFPIKDSETIVPLQAGTNKFASQQNSEVVMGCRRNQTSHVRGGSLDRHEHHHGHDHHQHNRTTEGLLPFQSGTNIFASQSGMRDVPGIGAFRQITTECESLNISDEVLRQSSVYTPIQSGSNKFASQTGCGGFLVRRDVIYKSQDFYCVGGRQIPEELARKSDGIVPLQSGTNKFANQSGMTNYGTPRDVTTKCKWKQQWIEQMEEAENEFRNQSVQEQRSMADSVTTTRNTLKPTENDLTDNKEEN